VGGIVAAPLPILIFINLFYYLETNRHHFLSIVKCRLLVKPKFPLLANCRDDEPTRISLAQQISTANSPQAPPFSARSRTLPKLW